MADNNYRVQVDQGTVAPQTSAIRLTDIFQRATPIPDAGKGAAELAQTFGAMKPVVAEVGKVWEQQKYDEGVQARLTGTLADGTKIKDGELPFTGSQRFMEGYHVTDGKLLAQQVGQAVHADWDQSDIKNNPDPNAAAAFFNSKFQEKATDLGLDKANQFVRAGYAAAIPQHINNMYARQGEAVEQFIHQDTAAKLQMSLQGAMDNYYSMGPDYQNMSGAEQIKKLHGDFDAIMQNPTFKALKPTEQKDSLAAVYDELAIKSRDPSVWMDYPSWGMNAKINKKYIEERMYHVKTLQQADMNFEITKRNYEANKAFVEVIDRLKDDKTGEAIRSPEVQAAMAKVALHPELYRSLDPIIQAQRMGVHLSTPEQEAQKMERAMAALDVIALRGEDPREQVHTLTGPERPGDRAGITYGGIRDIGNIAKLNDRARELSQTQPLYTKDSYKDSLADVARLFGATNYDMVTQKLDGLSPQMVANFIKAKNELQRRVREEAINYMDQNNSRTPTESVLRNVILKDIIYGKNGVLRYGPESAKAFMDGYVAPKVGSVPAPSPATPGSPKTDPTDPAQARSILNGL